MKRILITGARSYIGTGVERYLMEYNGKFGREEYRVDTVSLREESWKNYDFSSYDTVFHVAGIAHADVGKVPEEGKELYYRINCDLAVETAKKAKEQGVAQFIYMSSIIVYGESAPVGKHRMITTDTQPSPANFYGDSKLQAEKALEVLGGDGFQVAILRPPMIYGNERGRAHGRGESQGESASHESKGNYALLSRIAEKVPVFPKIPNERSMLYIENLGEFVRLLAESGKGGVFFPQNGEYTTTSRMVQAIGKAKGRKVYLWKVLNLLVYLAAKVPGRIGGMVNKAFGSMVYTKDMSREVLDGYQIYTLEESIERTERRL